ncbi:hypothetical protein AB0399_39790 [Streptomyces sp. NPDC088194]|uniref:DUF6907 domain-containing protein n=1 Tax=Streptomyces sp. NPDC088194 TaxID=3154931 RepID=UPI00344B1637
MYRCPQALHRPTPQETAKKSNAERDFLPARRGCRAAPTSAHLPLKETAINEEHPAQAPQPADAVEQPKPWSTPGSWTITTTSGFATSGYLPDWAEDDPSEAGVPLDQLPLRLGGINHRNFFEGPMMPLTATNSRDDAEEDAVFAGSIDCNPYDTAIRLRVPVVNIQVSPGHWILGLEPQELADIASKLGAQADLLQDEVLPALIAAREDWSAHHPERPLTTSVLPPGLTQAEATARSSAPPHQVQHTDQPEGR